MSSLNTVRLPDGTTLNIAEWLHWPVFSTIEFAEDVGVNLEAFSYVRGQRVPQQGTIPGGTRTANDRDTNMLRRRKMGQDEAIVVFSITYEIFGLSDGEDQQSPPQTAVNSPGVTPANVRRLQKATTVELMVGAHIKKPQVEVPFSWVPQTIGTYFDGAGSRSQNPATGGQLSPRAARKLQLPVYIGGYGESAKPGNSMHFKLRYRSWTGSIDRLNQDIRIRWWLDGLKKRPG